MIFNDYFEYPGVILDALVAICKEYHSKVFKLEGDKWDLERGIKIRILEVPTCLSIFWSNSDQLVLLLFWHLMIKPPRTY